MHNPLLGPPNPSPSTSPSQAPSSSTALVFPAMPSPAVLASGACEACRKRKRKCTRALPACSLCLRSQRPCDYGHGHVSAPASNAHAQVSPAAAAVAPSPPSSEFPASFFLDFEYFQSTKASVPLPPLSLPPTFTGPLKGQSRMYTIEFYFASVHTFFPIVSKLRLYRELAQYQGDASADTELLLMTMQLHSAASSENPAQQSIYLYAKDCCAYVERSNVFSIRLLQATLLVALYEVSHAIYPAAYLTVGHCARLGQAMGVHSGRRAPQMLSQIKTFVESEERRRVWWAVIILDRYVNIGSSGRSFACEDVKSDHFLPIDDESWNQGEASLIQPLAVSTSETVRTSPFARTCQAAHVLSRVLRHINDRDAEAEFRYQEAAQLHRTTQALAATIDKEAEELGPLARLPLCTAISLCDSARLALYDYYCCVERADAVEMGRADLLDLQKIAISGLREVSSKVFTSTERIRTITELGELPRMTPLVCDSLYQTGAAYFWYAKETGNWDDVLRLKDLKSVLDVLGKRWRAAREYSKILDCDGEYKERYAPL